MKKLTTQAILMTMLFLTCASWVQAEPLTIVRDGKTDAVILLQINADRDLVTAVEDLTAYIKKMTGVTIPVITIQPFWRQDNPSHVNQTMEADALNLFSGPIISVGQTVLASQLQEAEKWPRLNHREAYRVKRSGRVIVIQGNDWGHFSQEGARHVVYFFLEHLGVRWFIPEDLGERYPVMKDLTINDLELSGEPTMGYRAAFNYGDYTVNWARRNHLGGYNLESAHNWETVFAPPDGYKDTRYVGEYWFTRHPNWIFGPRRAPDLTNPEVRNRFIETALQAFKDSPD